MCNRPMSSQDDREQGRRIEREIGTGSGALLLAGAPETIKTEVKMFREKGIVFLFYFYSSALPRREK